MMSIKSNNSLNVILESFPFRKLKYYIDWIWKPPLNENYSSQNIYSVCIWWLIYLDNIKIYLFLEIIWKNDKKVKNIEKLRLIWGTI